MAPLPVEFLSLRTAARSANVAHTTIKEWCTKYGIGRQREDGRWIVSRPGLQRVMAARRVLGRG